MYRKWYEKFPSEYLNRFTVSWRHKGWFLEFSIKFLWQKKIKFSQKKHSCRAPHPAYYEDNYLHCHAKAVLSPTCLWILQFLGITERSYRVFPEQRDIYPGLKFMSRWSFQQKFQTEHSTNYCRAAAPDKGNIRALVSFLGRRMLVRSNHVSPPSIRSELQHSACFSLAAVVHMMYYNESNNQSKYLQLSTVCPMLGAQYPELHWVLTTTPREEP